MNSIIQDLLGNVFFFLVGIVLASGVKRRSRFYVRLALTFVGFSAIRFLYYNLFLLLFEGEINYKLRTYGFILILALLIVCLYLIFDSDIWTALFLGGVSYSIQHVGQRIYSVLIKLWNFTSGTTPEIAYIALFIGIVALLTALIYLVKRLLRIENVIINNRAVLVFTVFVAFANIVLEDWITAVRIGKGEDVFYCLYVLSIIISSLNVVISFMVLSNKKIANELDQMKEMMKEERSQYVFEKNMIDLINVKAHDLKHRISSEVTESDKAAVDGYDSTFDTEHVALNVILTKKNFTCREKGIDLSCMADGKLLSFMEEVEVYSLFGNILDNAIEATEKIEDKTKRVIALSVFSENGFIFIREDNYFTGELSFAGGLPRSTKGNDNMHGFGTKSIRMIVERYGGSVHLSAEEDRFSLNAIIPPKKK